MKTPFAANASSGTTTTATNHGGGAMVHTSSVDPLVTLRNERAALEAKSVFWFDFLIWATIAVAIGVMFEFADDAAELYHAIKNKSRLPIRKLVVFVGTVLVVLGVAAEFVADAQSGGIETKLRTNNAASERELDKRARVATQAAVTLAEKFGGLTTLVNTKAQEADDQRRQFEELAKADEAKNSAILADLARNRDQLSSARTDAVAAASAAKHDVSEMDAALSEERALRQRYAEMVVPRAIDDTHFNKLVDDLKKHAKTTIELALTREPECGDLLVRLFDAMKAAGWDIENWSGGDLTLHDDAREDMPTLGEITAHHVQVQISDADKDKLTPAAELLIQALNEAGIPTMGKLIPEKLQNGKPNPQPMTKGRIRLVIGTRN